MSEYAIPTPKVSPNTLIGLLKTMTLIRRFEEKIVEVYPVQDMKSPVHLYIGEEAVATGVCAHLTRQDYIFTTHRSHGHCLAKGVDPAKLYAEFYGRITGCCKGKGGSMHPADPEHGILGTSAIVGGVIPLAVGTALKSYLVKEDRVSVAFFGDGASDEGAFHESLNFASLKRLPVVFVCENNFYATNSPLSARQPHDQIYKRAAGYAMPGLQADGNDVLGVYGKAKWAIERARKGEGPTLLECRTYRWKGHVGPDCDYKQGCRPKEELESWMDKCPIDTFKNQLAAKKILSEGAYHFMVREIDSQLESAIQSARQSAFPGPDEVFKDVYYQGV
jgi:pyruvate dehydrogenase E1 component alpha subunit